MYTFKNNTPIYVQLMNDIKMQVVSGALKEKSKVKSVRELAAEYGVNPNTVQKALSELEKEGFLKAEKTTGRFVTLPQEKMKDVKMMLAEEKASDFIAWMLKTGYTSQEINELVKQQLKKEGA